MCQPFSCVVKSDLSVLVGQTVTCHSHAKILQQHGLPTEISTDQYAKVELEFDVRYPADPDQWELELDEERKPSWWEENLPEIEDRVRQAAWKWLAKIKATSEFSLGCGDILHLPFGNPVVTLTDGVLWALGQSAPVVTQSGGRLLANGNSAPVVTLHGGELRAYDHSAPVVTQSGGKLLVFGHSAPVVTQSGGKLWAYGESAPVVQLIDGELRAYDHSAPVVNGVQLRPGQTAVIVAGELLIEEEKN